MALEFIKERCGDMKKRFEDFMWVKYSSQLKFIIKIETKLFIYSKTLEGGIEKVNERNTVQQASNSNSTWWIFNPLNKAIWWTPQSIRLVEFDIINCFSYIIEAIQNKFQNQSSFFSCSWNIFE